MTLKEQCLKFGLDAPAAFWHADALEIGRIYNGAGPDNLPKALSFLDATYVRQELTEWLKLFELAFVIHDYEFAFSDGTEASFHAANKRMLANMKKILDAEYPFWKFWTWGFRSRWWLRAKAAYIACERFGLDAWRD